jgi:hypothetical protein
MKRILPIVIISAVVGGGAFWGGMEYAQNGKTAGGIYPDMEDLSLEERSQMRQQFGANIESALKDGQSGERLMNKFVNGEIIAKDEQSIIVKLPDGGSKIVFFSESTEITKSVSGSRDSLAEGGQVIVNGSENSDGSYTATTIQIKP